MSYKLTKAAEMDLEKIWYYTYETWSKEQADHYVGLIFDEMDYLAVHPKSGVDISDIRSGYFRSRVKSHFIFYRLNKKENGIEIIRILHNQMDVTSRLTE